MELMTTHDEPIYHASNKLSGRRALVTGGDSGIGAAVAKLFAREGADVAITYLASESGDAGEVQKAVIGEGRRCILIEGDLSDPDFCEAAVRKTVDGLGGIDILVSNAAYQRRKSSLTELTPEEWDQTFKTNIYAYYHLVRAAVPYMKAGSAIIATSSETAFLAPSELPDYSASNGAINTFTKSLAHMLVSRGIRVNAVSPGFVWTPVNSVGRPARPEEIAPSYVFLACDADSSYITGVILPEEPRA